MPGQGAPSTAWPSLLQDRGPPPSRTSVAKPATAINSSVGRLLVRLRPSSWPLTLVDDDDVYYPRGLQLAAKGATPPRRSPSRATRVDGALCALSVWRHLRRGLHTRAPLRVGSSHTHPWPWTIYQPLGVLADILGLARTPHTFSAPDWPNTRGFSPRGCRLRLSDGPNPRLARAPVR